MKLTKTNLLLLSGCLALSSLANADTKVSEDNILVSAVAWKQTAAEYKALYYQAYNLAKIQLDNALANKKDGDKPLAVITDIDDTILNASNYWGYLINNDKDFFDDSVWDKWVSQNKFTAMPGALDFFNYAKSKGVEVFYVSSRDQGEDTFKNALGNLTALKFPYADKEHMFILTESSNKEPAQKEIAQRYNVVVMLGDNLNDFSRKFYVTDVDERAKLVDEDRDLFGSKFIIMPNPTDGHWVRAIFGESEPAATDANRKTFRKAAAKSAWQQE